MSMRHRRPGLRLRLPGTPCVRIVYDDETAQPRAYIDQTIDWAEARRRFDDALRNPDRSDGSTTAILLSSPAPAPPSLL